MNRLVVCATIVLAVGAVACSSDNNNGQNAGLGTFASLNLAVDSSPVSLHVIRNPADTIPPSDTVNFVPLPFFVGVDAVDRTPTVIVLPSGDTVSNGLNNVAVTFSNPGIAEINGNGAIQGDSTGTTVLTYTLTDYNHNRSTQSVDIPITVTLAAAGSNRVHLNGMHLQRTH